MKAPESKKPKPITGGVFYLMTIVAMLFLAIGLFNRQIIEQSHYRKKEEEQNQRRIITPAARGNIYDRKGRLLAGNRPLFNAVLHIPEILPEIHEHYLRKYREYREELSSHPNSILNKLRTPNKKIKEIKDQAKYTICNEYLQSINQYLQNQHSLNPKDVKRHFHQDRLLPLILVKNLSQQEYAQITDNVPTDSPIQIASESARYYPYGDSAAHILGYVSSTREIPTQELPGGNLRTLRLSGNTGRAGIEKFLDLKLSGANGFEIWRIGSGGYQDHCLEKRLPVQGKSLQLSIDIALQQTAEKAFQEHIGAAVVLKVQTGEVLALVSQPNYDLNDLSPYMPYSVYDNIEEQGAWLNRATQGSHPPGSTFKPITALAALANQHIEPDESIYCAKSFTVGNQTFHEHNRKSFGWINLERALAISSNVYFYQLSLEIGIDKISTWARKFGLNKSTSLHGVEETSSMIIPDREWKKKTYGQPWFPGDTVNVSIGQGATRVTPLQMACFTASLARGQLKTVPKIIKDSKHQIDSQPIPVKEEYLQAIYQGMKRAVEQGTAKNLKMENIEIAAKTGSAQTSYKGEKQTLAWIIAFAPIKKPEIALSVLVEPKSSSDNFSGGKTAGPIAATILKHYFNNK